MTRYVLLGAGTIGRVVARQLKEAGNPALAFADNDVPKQHHLMEDIPVFCPDECREKYPDAIWIATVMQPKFRDELLKQIAQMGVKSEELWTFLPHKQSAPPSSAIDTLDCILEEKESIYEFHNQIRFRRREASQRPASDISEIYFPDWIMRRDDEHFVDCGAADGDTIAEFVKRWPNYKQITAFEPDKSNLEKLCGATWQDRRIIRFNAAISDHFHKSSFTSTGDYSAHLGGDGAKVHCWKLDDILNDSENHPTYIKMDIEGSELEALWGARRIIREHSPVLAICAYHTADHLWQIPLLIHAINPDLKLFLRRYAEGTWELVWYAAPAERLK